MDKKKGKRINFRIAHCSSEDPQYPVTQLLHQSPESKGWQSKRFSPYPQTIVIQLVQTSFINKIAVLSHQSKIATKVQFQIKVNQDDDWKKLGRISLDSNTSTNFQARELKQANINDSEARFIRLILRQNHVNNQNLFNQVGLIGLSFYGNRSQDLPQVQSKNISSKSSNLEVDQGTMNRIKQLEMKKKKAIENQDYDECKNIKDQIERLKSMAIQLSSLEERKQEAIRRQNYDDAKLINEEIKRMRSGGQQPARQAPYKQESRHHEQQVAVSPMTNNRNNPQTRPQPIVQRPRQQQKRQQYKPPNIKQKQQSEEDRPINVKNPNPYDDPQMQQQQRKQSQLQPLNKQLYDECSQHFSVLDEEIMRHIFSKSHSNRERGIQMVLDEMKQTRNREDFIGACLYVVKNLVDDKSASVLLGTFNLMIEMLKKMKPQQSSYNQPLVDYILDKMGDYLGHTNQKIRATVEDAFINNFPMYHLIGKDSCYRALVIIGKRDKPPKILAGRLKVLNKLVIDYQLGKDYESVINYGVKYADDKNSDVRTWAITLLSSIAGQIGYAKLQPYIKNLRPPIIKSIEEKLQEGGNSNYHQFDQKPIKPKSSTKTTGKGKFQQPQLQVGNEFIQIPKKKSSQQQNQDEYCQFCKRHDKRFTEQDYKDMHYYNACPMLIICAECGQGVQVSTYTAHLVGECQNSKYYKKCPRCKEAVQQKIYKTHVEKKECLSAKPMAAANRCPLCHLDINPGVNGWKEHLVEQGCENNPRA